ncbi:hypothetical protein R3P38DRAFT_2822595 [Favolaschia claudopus]|uniref:DUF6697 domain-containing protein n=1 Tax=Favolaschia claudopus TaxID=2862362 RepID=A0AAW0EF13_9AGAR
MASSLDIRRTYMNPEWAADLVAMRTQLDDKESENQALRMEVHKLRGEIQSYKDALAQLSAPRQMQLNTGSGQRFFELTQQEWENMQNELATVKAQLERQTAISELPWSNRTSSVAHSQQSRPQAGPSSLAPRISPNPHTRCSTHDLQTSVAQSQPQAGPSSLVPQTSPNPHTNCSTHHLQTSSVAQSRPQAGPSSLAPQTLPKPQPLPNETVKSELVLVSAGPPTLPHPSDQQSKPRDQASGTPIVAGSRAVNLPLSTSTSLSSNMSLSAKPIATKEVPKTEDEDDLLVVQSAQSSYLSPLPEARRRELDSFPEFVPEADDVSSVFSRAHLLAVLGGNPQSLIVKIGASQKPLARECNVRKFLCPRLDHNPWCPRSAGTHGYMFVGLTTEDETFPEPEQLNLFLSVKVEGPLEVTYLGIYEVARVQALTAEEWCTLSEPAQIEYAKTTLSRENKSSTKVEDMRSEYSQGLRHVPCVRLRCVGFDETLYAGLVDPSRSNNKRSLGSTDSGRSPKRRRRREETSL